MKAAIIIRRQYQLTLEEEEADRIKAFASYVQKNDFEEALKRSGKKATAEGAEMVESVVALIKAVADA